jgi:hypothetical protein
MSSPSACGPHTELASNNAVRVTRCTCGTVHVTILSSGVTVRLSVEATRGLANGLRAAMERMEAPPVVLGTTTIN